MKNLTDRINKQWVNFFVIPLFLPFLILFPENFSKDKVDSKFEHHSVSSPNTFGYVPLFTQSTFANRSVNTNYIVGITPGGHEVSLSGGATYSIPIYTTPGTNGMEPALSLAYNSQGGNGKLGMGWDIAGLSVISRVGEDIYHDGKVSAGSLFGDPSSGIPTCNFALDGNRLVGESGIYGADNSIYKTEIETFSRITSFGEIGYSYNVNGVLGLNFGPAWFKVETKSGSTVYYGNSTDSRFTSDIQGTCVIFWRVNKVVDIFGNYCEYIYENSNRDSRISEIRYTGNVNGLTPYNRIKFTYKDRFDVNTAYIQGESIKNSYLVESIEVFTDDQTPNTLVKKYLFNYGYDGLYSYLTEVVEYGSDGTSRLNSTIFKYGDKTSNYNSSFSSNISDGLYDLIPGDFDGDGVSDIIRASFNNTAQGIKYYTNLEFLRKNPATAAFTAVCSTALPVRACSEFFGSENQ